uniref:HtrA serine peptidase 3a n=1 Tax=Astyanax mexicanus TaxID=7994 RepID=A0A8B9RGR1_ASTMX
MLPQCGTPSLLFLPLFILFILSAATGAEPRARCPSSCDVSSCPSPSCPAGYVPDRCGCCLVCALGEGAPCGGAQQRACGDGLRCGGGSGGKRLCQCKLRYRVCGSDRRTYSTPCALRAASRRAQLRGQQINKKTFCQCLDFGYSPHFNSPRYKFNFIADVVEKIAPAVVHIELHPVFGRRVPLSSGSGFIMTDSGLIVTNAHVVTSSATVAGRQQLRVQLHDGQTFEATIRDIDKKSDIATIKVNTKKKLPVLAMGRSADLRPGEFVVAIGSPFALQNTVTTGIVSTAQRDGKELGIQDSDMDYIQTDAIINVRQGISQYGNSGGPLVNLDGEVIGINTLKVTAGISFAIPSDRINRFLDEFNEKHNKGKNLTMPYITVLLVEELKQHNPDFPDISSGILVYDVIQDSPAQQGGLETGDIIVKLNGHPIFSTDDLQLAIQEDTPLLLEVHRGNDDLLFNIEPHILMQ